MSGIEGFASVCNNFDWKLSANPAEHPAIECQKLSTRPIRDVTINRGQIARIGPKIFHRKKFSEFCYTRAPSRR
jgi:hypothetical protein